MAEAGPAGEHQAAGTTNDDGNAPFQASASVTQTTATEFSILLFNVSGASTAAGMAEAQREGIKRVLNSEELELNTFSIFIFCSDNVINKKKTEFYNKLQTSHRTRNENAAIFYNKTAQTEFSPEYVPEIPVLPLHLKHRKQKQKAKEHIQSVENYVTEWTGKKEIVGDQLLEDARQHCQEAMSLLDKCPLRDTSYKALQEFRDDCLGRVAVTLIKWPHSGQQRGLRILLASWHGPHNGISSDKGEEYFLRIILFIEKLRKYYETHVAVLGGDFNLDTDPATANIENLRSQLQGITLFSFSDEKLMYTVVWPAGYLELQPGFPKEIHPEFPTVTVKDKELEPFNHPILLYRFAIKLPETKERENERERERERRAGQAYDVGTEERGGVVAEVDEEQVGRDDDEEEVDEKEEEEEETDEEEEGVEEEEEEGVDEEEVLNILFSKDCSLG